MKTIVITGTSRGIGLQAALAFVDLGHQVFCLSRNSHPALIAHEKTVCIATDLSEADGLDLWKEFIVREKISPDILIHNSGQLISKPFSQLTPEDFERVYRVNVFGVAELTRICLPYMKPGGHVLGISSMGGVQGTMKFPGLAAYSSSKGALITLMEVLAEEYKESGIAFNTLALGAVQTEMLAEAFPGYQAGVSASEMGAYVVDFALNGPRFYNGKVLQVSMSTP